MKKLRIGLVHATAIAIDPIKAAFASGWPDVELMHLFDDRLSPDRAVVADLTPDLVRRIDALGTYARSAGADAILYTCSAFGSAIEKTAERLDVPVLKPNEAMFEAAIEAGPDAALVVTFEPALAGMVEEFEDEVKRRGATARLHAVVARGAIEAINAGDAERHNTLVAETVKGVTGVDSIMLAHFSTSRAREACGAVTDIPVLTSPGAAVAKLRRVLNG